MDNIELTGSIEDVIFELRAMKDFYMRFYDIQDEQTKKEICISIEAIDKKIKELEDK